MLLRQKVFLAMALLATFRKAILLGLTMLFGCHFSETYTPRDQMRILLVTGIIVALLSAAMAIFLPEYGMSSQGEWKGIFAHKNRLGISILYLFSAIPFARGAIRWSTVALWVSGLGGLGLILLAKSKTSLILSIVLVGFAGFARMVRRMKKSQLPFMIYSAGLLTLTIILIISINLSAIAPIFGRDATFSGRTKNWAILSVFALRHLWIGYGYQAFWTGASGDSGSAIAGIGGAMHGADNGYVDTLLQFGIVGLVLVAALLWTGLRNMLRALSHPGTPLTTYWFAGMFLATIVGNVTETLLWVPTGITAFFVVIAYIGLQPQMSQASLPHRRRDQLLKS
jgi:exopolysaccharide production protein ExoQ